MTKPYADREIWFLTGSQGLYGEETLRQVAEQSQEIARRARATQLPAKVVWKPVLTDSDAIRRAALEANADDSVIGVIAWMHTFSPAKMWIAGLDALRTPLLHLHTQANVELPWDTHRLRLHEPQPGRARRPRVRVHRHAAGRGAQDGRRPRVATRP